MLRIYYFNLNVELWLFKKKKFMVYTGTEEKFLAWTPTLHPEKNRERGRERKTKKTTALGTVTIKTPKNESFGVSFSNFPFEFEFLGLEFKLRKVISYGK